MIYMSGDNNLAEEMIGGLQQIHGTGVNTLFNAVALFDSGGPLKKYVVPQQRDQGNSSQSFDIPRLELTTVDFEGKDEKGEKIKIRRVPGVLKAFVTDTVRNYPAKNYMLVLSGHGSGAVGDFLASRSSSLSIQDIRGILQEVQQEFARSPYATESAKYPKGKIDILGLDSCLMSMAEVAYEVRSVVSYVVGAEGFEPNTGWPYGRLLKRLNSLATLGNSELLEAEGLATDMVRTYIENYVDYRYADLSTDQAALDLTRIPVFQERLSLLAMALQQALERQKPNETDPIKDAILLAHWEAQGYKDEQYVDLWDFCHCLSERCEKAKIAPEIRNACYAVQQAIGTSIEPGLVLLSCYSGSAFQHSNGVSVFFPWADLTDAAGVSDLDHYSQLQFAETAWAGFLRVYLDKTRRRLRPGVGRLETSRLRSLDGKTREIR